jgi:UDP-N-acetylglucosamine 2-epimerase (non-hydrolysing)
MKKILLVFGTRPEAIKMAPVYLALKKADSFIVKVCVTGQHRDMLDQVLDAFGIIPDYDLNIMKPGQDLFDITTGVLLAIKEVYEAFRPDRVLVHGDTSTSFGASLAAFYLQIPVGHVEAGLRTGDMSQPFPEEANRVLTGRLADLHFAPTVWAKNNLLKEGISAEKILVTGNTVIDALFWVLGKIGADLGLRRKVEESIRAKGYPLRSDKEWILVTCHRRENAGGGFEEIAEAIKTLSSHFQHLDFVFPVHPNPKVREIFTRVLQGIPNVYLIQPLDYVPFVLMMGGAICLLSDSGGVQEEAPALGKKVFVMRNVSERPEAIEEGLVELVGTDKDQIIMKLTEEIIQRPIRKAFYIYGDGNASERIISVLSTHK